MAELTRVFMIAENRLLREAVARILGKRQDITLVGCGPLSSDAEQLIAEAQAETLLVGEALALRSDFKFIREIHSAHPELRIVLIGMDHDEELFIRAVRAGIVGYVLKDASAQVIVEAVRAVSRNEAACPPTLCFALFRRLAKGAIHAPTFRLRLDFGLTRREQQLVPLIAQGLTNKEIAFRLNLSEQTIKNHICRLLRKAGAKDRLSAVDILLGQEVQI